jgi:hypothetical protein
MDLPEGSKHRSDRSRIALARFLVINNGEPELDPNHDESIFLANSMQLCLVASENRFCVVG